VPTAAVSMPPRKRARSSTPPRQPADAAPSAPTPKPKNRQPEAELQVACVDWLKEKALVHYGTTGGAMYAGSKGARARTAQMYKKRGATPGVPDLLVFAAGAHGEHGLGVELKIGAVQPTAVQQQWHADLRRVGWAVEVARTLEQFKDIVTHYLPPDGSEAAPLDLTLDVDA